VYCSRCEWWAGYSRSFSRAGLRRGMTILELLVVMSSLTVLLSLLLPAIQAAREATRNVECTHNLRQIGLALHAYQDSHRTLPAGWQPDEMRESSYGWATEILPQLEETCLSEKIERSPAIHALPRKVRTTTPSVYLCSSDPGEPEFPMFAEIGEHGSHAQLSAQILVTLPRASYVGVFGTIDPDDVPGESGDGIFVARRGYRFEENERGASHLLMVGERTTRKLPSTWLGFAAAGEDAAGRIVGHANLGPNRDDADECEFDSRHPGHVNFAWADGHVSGISDDVDRVVYRQSAARR
jgi:prepilin-type processing-associated H-X9-DG protein